MLIFKRNQIVITALIVVILCAGYLNFKYNKAKLSSTDGKTPIGTAYFVKNENTGGADDTASVAKINGDYFVVTRADKERTRDEQKEMMKSIIDNKNSDKAAKDKAQEEMLKISKNAEKEMIIEGVLKGKGFADVVAFINDGKVDIVVKDDANLLVPSQQAMILDVVSRETGVSPENVKINPQKPAQQTQQPEKKN